jgi:FkbH-like protein
MALHYKQRGVVLCVASKNTEEIALEAFRKHPEMALRESDVAVFQINWGDKASSIKGMAESLNLGLESFVLIDDNPAERKQVRDTLPLVAVPELPPDPADWLRVIQAAAYFEQTSFSAEDLQRSEYYKRNAARNMQAKAIGDQKGFLESLKMVLTVKPFDALGRTRITQLVAKSNQFNLTTRRYSESEIAAFEADAECETLQARLEDVFGDNGMISVVICRKTAACWYIDTWIMSCRVLGRGVERALLNVIAARARAAGAEELRGTYIPTAKNGIVRDHYSSLGFSKLSEENGSTHWTLRLRDFAPSAESIDVRATP